MPQSVPGQDLNRVDLRCSRTVCYPLYFVALQCTELSPHKKSLPHPKLRHTECNVHHNPHTYTPHPTHPLRPQLRQIPRPKASLHPTAMLRHTPSCPTTYLRRPFYSFLRCFTWGQLYETNYIRSSRAPIFLNLILSFRCLAPGREIF